VLCFLHCDAQKLFFGEFGHIHGKVDAGLFSLYLTLLSYHSSWHVENLEVISCSFSKRDSAIISTIYSTIVSFKGFKACFVHSWECLTRNCNMKFWHLIASKCLILRTVWTNSLVDNEGFPSWKVNNSSGSALSRSAEHYISTWWPSTSAWMGLYPIACGFWLLRFSVLRSVERSVSRVISSVAASAEWQWTDWCLHCCCVTVGGEMDGGHVAQFDLDPLTSSSGIG